MTLNKLIDVASNTDNNIYDVFIAAKVFASRLGNLELLNWIENEINGYPIKDSVYILVDKKLVPEYRIVTPTYSCLLIDPSGFSAPNSPVPLSWFKGKLGENYFNREAHVTRGIVSLQNSIKSGSFEDFIVHLPNDFDKAVDSETSTYSAGTLVRNIKIRIAESEIVQLLAVIRNKLLDLLLTIERKFPDLKEIVASSPQEQKELINQTIHITMAKDSKTNISGTNITTSGSGNNVNANVGTGNTINSANVSATGKAIADFVATVRSEMEKHEFPAKAALVQQLDLLEEEAQKPEPKSSDLNTGLDIINGLLLSVAANAWTEPILQSLAALKVMILG